MPNEMHARSRFHLEEGTLLASEGPLGLGLGLLIHLPRKFPGARLSSDRYLSTY